MSTIALVIVILYVCCTMTCLLAFYSGYKALNFHIVKSITKVSRFSASHSGRTHRLFSIDSSSTATATTGGGNNRKKIVFLGTPDVAAKSLEILIDKSYPKNKDSIYEVTAIVTQPPAIAGRNKKLTSSPVQLLAEQHNIPVHNPELAKDESFLQSLKTIQPDLCITAAYGNFLPTKFLNIPKYGTLNIHPSLLPLYRGAAPIQRCLENGDETTGVSIVFTVLKMDAGPIVHQSVRRLDGHEKAPDLLMEMFSLGTNKLIDCLPSVFDSTISMTTATKQDEDRATSASKIVSIDGKINFQSMNALDIHNRGRGFAGWPGIYSTFQIGDNSTETQRIKIITTVPLERNANTVPIVDRSSTVTVLKQNKVDMLRVVCGDGSVLGITELQPANKKAMDSRSFINGMRGTLKWTVPSDTD